MSHEIRTPLNGIVGFTDLLKQHKLTEVQKQYVNNISYSSDSLLDIINDILDFSKIEAGKLELSVEKVDIYDTLSKVVDMINFQANQKKLEVLLHIAQDVPKYLWIDELRIKQILVNLLSNAVKFTKEGEVELKVSKITSSEHQNIFRFAVRDTGVGIAQKNITKIFEAFTQEDSSTTKRFGGTGLGLTISNMLLKLMQSNMQLDSVLEKGSTFYFDIALNYAVEDIINYASITSIKKALIVDDNTNNRIILKDMLQFRNIIADEAINGSDALALTQQHNYDVIIMDYNMPEMDGLEAIKKIREGESPSSNSPTILLYSSSNDNKIIEFSKAYRIDQKLVKPIKIKQLYETLAKLKSNTQLPIEQAFTTLKATESTIKKTIKHYKILIAEDNSINMLLAKTVVKSILENVIIIEASNGNEAIIKYESEKPDLILMDVQMPELNGYDTTTALRRLDNEIPIIALTAGVVNGEKEKCISFGMSDYITKPFSKETLEKIIHKWIK
jgi:CheY-like chemotaxis protein